MIYIDTHTHTLEHKKDASVKIRESIESATKKNIDILCLTDHHPLPPGWKDPTLDQDCAMSDTMFQDYLIQRPSLISLYEPDITVLQGAEVDWIPSHQTWTKAQISAHHYDYLIGSVHFIGSLLIDYTPDMWRQAADHAGGTERLIQTYFSHVRDMISSRLFDGIGHLDLIKKWNKDEVFFSESSPWYKREIEHTLNHIASSGMAMEINTAGWEKQCTDAYPSEWIVQQAFVRDIPLTIGSDGHTPDRIGQRLAQGIHRAKLSGYKKLVYYKQRIQQEVII